MPSNKTPSVVSPGTGLPVASTAAASAIGEALREHIDDPVGAHAGSAISYAAGPAWYDGGTNPDANVQVEIDKILSDLTAAAGGPVVDGAGKIGWYAGANWANGDTNPTTSVGLQLRKIITDLATSGSSPSGAHHIGAAAQADSFTNAPQTLLADEVYSQLSSLLLYANTPYRTVVVDTGAPTYAITAAPRVTTFLVDASAAGRRIDMPAVPADHKGWRWYVIDTAGSSAEYNITLRSGASTINGFSGDLLVGKDHGQWVITCDGTNFFVEEVRLPTVAVLVSAGNSPYTVDSNGVQNDLIFVRTSAGRTVIFPTASACKGRVWRIVDEYGSSHIFPITLLPTGGSINSYSGSITVGKPFGEWLVTCDGIAFFVQELRAPTMQPPVVTAATYDLDAGALQFDDVYVDATSAPRALILPQYPASHKNQKWHIYDVSTLGSNDSITLQRYAGATYTVNGVAGDLIVKASSATHNFGHWIVICDGTSFWSYEVPPATGGLDWQNTWTQTNTFSHVSPLAFDYAGDQIITKSTAGDLELSLLGEFRIRMGIPAPIFNIENATKTLFKVEESAGGSGTKRTVLTLGTEGPGSATPFNSDVSPDAVYQALRSANGAPAFEIGSKGVGNLLTKISSGGMESAGAARTHLVFDLNNNEGLGELITILPTMSVLIDPATSSWYTLKTQLGGVRSRGRKPPADSVCLLEAWVCMLGVQDGSLTPYNGSRWTTMRRACGYCASDGTTYTVQDDTQVFLSDDSGLTNPPPLAQIIADANGFHIQVKAGSDVADWRQLFWGYLKVTTLTFSSSYDESV